VNHQAPAVASVFFSKLSEQPVGDFADQPFVVVKAKNRLSADDATLVEESFAAKMTLGPCGRWIDEVA
jgi:hypothetical protein